MGSGCPVATPPSRGSCMWVQGLGSSVCRVRGEWVSVAPLTLGGHPCVGAGPQGASVCRVHGEWVSVAPLPLGGRPRVGAGPQGFSVCRAGSLSAHTVAAGAAPAEHRAPTSTHPRLWAAQDSARHTTLSWEQLFLRAVPRPDEGHGLSVGRFWCSSAVICRN